jgi:hypothetical protein
MHIGRTITSVQTPIIPVIGERTAMRARLKQFFQFYFYLGVNWVTGRIRNRYALMYPGQVTVLLA